MRYLISHVDSFVQGKEKTKKAVQTFRPIEINAFLGNFGIKQVYKQFTFM